MAAGSSPTSPSRRLYIDWLRGLAVLFMVLWHVVDSWHVPEGRDSAAFAAVVFFAGWAAPMFLFLAGVSLPMAARAQMARGLDREAAVRMVLTRGWLVFLLAHLFRFQSFLLSPNATWSGLLKPDILNVLGLGMVLAALAWRRATSGRGRLLWLLLPAVVVCVLTPWARDWWWPSLLHPRLEGYIRIVSGNAVFSLLPTLAYVFAGTFVGSLLVETPSDGEERLHLRIAAVGAGLLVVAIGATFVAVSEAIDRWMGPGLIVALRVGSMLLALVVMRSLLLRRAPAATHPMVALGRASLVVYWVHVEIAYGNFSYPVHKTLSLTGSLVGYGGVTIAMYCLAVWWLRRPSGRPLVPAHMVAPRPRLGRSLSWASARWSPRE